MNKNERAIIDLSLQILTEARDRSSKEKVDTLPVRLALRSLLPYMPLHWPLHSFWSGTSGDNEIGRSASCTAALNGIKVQLRAGRVKVGED